MHILVVEDDRPLARILRKSIESSGHTVDIVGDGDEGLRMARTRAHDALVLDLQLPRLSGIEVCRRLRDDGNAVPIIMLTARGAVPTGSRGSTSAPTTTWPSRSRWPSCRPVCGRSTAGASSSRRSCSPARWSSTRPPASCA